MNDEQEMKTMYPQQYAELGIDALDVLASFYLLVNRWSDLTASFPDQAPGKKSQSTVANSSIRPYLNSSIRPYLDHKWRYTG